MFTSKKNVPNVGPRCGCAPTTSLRSVPNYGPSRRVERAAHYTLFSQARVPRPPGLLQLGAFRPSWRARKHVRPHAGGGHNKRAPRAETAGAGVHRRQRSRESVTSPPSPTGPWTATIACPPVPPSATLRWKARDPAHLLSADRRNASSPSRGRVPSAPPPRRWIRRAA